MVAATITRSKEDDESGGNAKSGKDDKNHEDATESMATAARRCRRRSVSKSWEWKLGLGRLVRERR